MTVGDDDEKHSPGAIAFGEAGQVLAGALHLHAHRVEQSGHAAGDQAEGERVGAHALDGLELVVELSQRHSQLAVQRELVRDESVDAVLRLVTDVGHAAGAVHDQRQVGVLGVGHGCLLRRPGGG